MLVFINAAKGVTKANVFVTSMSKNHMVAVMNLKALSVARRWGYECGGSDPLATYMRKHVLYLGNCLLAANKITQNGGRSLPQTSNTAIMFFFRGN